MSVKPKLAKLNAARADFMEPAEAGVYAALLKAWEHGVTPTVVSSDPGRSVTLAVVSALASKGLRILVACRAAAERGLVGQCRKAAMDAGPAGSDADDAIVATYRKLAQPDAPRRGEFDAVVLVNGADLPDEESAPVAARYADLPRVEIRYGRAAPLFAPSVVVHRGQRGVETYAPFNASSNGRHVAVLHPVQKQLADGIEAALGAGACAVLALDATGYGSGDAVLYALARRDAFTLVACAKGAVEQTVAACRALGLDVGRFGDGCKFTVEGYAGLALALHDLEPGTFDVVLLEERDALDARRAKTVADAFKDAVRIEVDRGGGNQVLKHDAVVARDAATGEVEVAFAPGDGQPPTPRP